MKKHWLLLTCFVFFSATQAQERRKAAIIVNLEDSLTHNYLGLTAFQLILGKKYPSPFSLIDTLKQCIETSFREEFKNWDLVFLNPEYGFEYFRQIENMNNKEKKAFRLEWYDSIRNQHQVEAVIIFRNSKSMEDEMGNSKYYIPGYGIYNGAYQNYNMAYIKLVSYLFLSSKPVRVAGGKKYIKNKDYPRITRKDESFTDNDLMVFKEPLAFLINLQIKSIFKDLQFASFRR